MEIKSVLFDIFIIGLLILFNALFVAIEFAIIRVRASEIEADGEKRDNKRLKYLRVVKDNIDVYVSAAQLGITLVNILLGWIGEDSFSRLFLPVFRFMGLESALGGTAATIIGILLITFITVSVGEQAPKMIAIQYPRTIALWLTIPLHIFYKIFKPFILFLNWIANSIIKMLGMKPVTKDEILHSEEEIRYLIAEGRKTGVIDSTEHQLIEKIFDFNDKMARDIMVPRNSMIALDISDHRDRIIQTVIDEGYSRIPVYNENFDNIIGIIYSKDLISATEHRELIVLMDILRPAYFVPETIHIGELLKDFQRKHIHLGIVVNEHGGVEGLITLEDIIEEIVGEIEDEYDIETRNVQKDKLGIFLVDPVISIEEFNGKFNSDIPVDNDDYHTLSGFLQMVTGHVPDIYERIDYKDIVFTVTKKSGNKLLQVKMQRMQL
ncbi:MAG: hemolysin family protein [Ignavibacteriae bacterium]|jgi:CBS domain containing-hemolysin-like protein|nr:hemolysin family protein [Ignavibacteriota bacterium]